jgi:hypothetical protein
VAVDDDDLRQIPWWDAKALRMASAIEKSIVRLNLDSQGEFVAIMNAIAMQLESPQTAPEVLRLLAEALHTLALARGIQQRDRQRLDERLQQLIERVTTTSQEAPRR